MDSKDNDVIYRSYRQGGMRYENVLSEQGADFRFEFVDNIYMSAGNIWSQLDGGGQFKSISPALIFGNTNPLYVEIGIGNGEFTAHHALNNPDTNWLGFEVFHKVFEKAASRARKTVGMSSSNIRLMQFDAELFVRLLPKRSVSGFFINFPDPWPKAKHTKRRIIKPWFIELMRTRLISGGLITVATDHADYALEITEHFKNAHGLVPEFETIFVNDTGDYYKTKYYRKFAEKGTVYFYKMRKP